MRNKLVLGAIILVALGTWMILNQQKADSIDEVDFKNFKVATFAGGCFWCIEASLEAREGVVEAISGYAGGTVENPTYAQVTSGQTGHFEAVQVYYDPEIVSYEELLDVFWRSIDPTDNEGQFADKGTQYRTAIFYHDEEQRALAEEDKNQLESSDIFDKPIVTEIRPYTTFYQAEEYHQDYYKKNVMRYNTYEELSGRPDFYEKYWNSDGAQTIQSPESVGQIPSEPATEEPATEEPVTDLEYLISSNPAQVDNSNLPITPIEEIHITGSALDVDIAQYNLTIDGLVDTTLVLTYDTLLKYPTVTNIVLLVCPGVFVDNAEWTDVPVISLLEEAGTKLQASQLIFHALDGYQTILSLEEIQRDGVFLAHTVNGQVLPREHGYPLRLVVAEEYGNAWVKWVNRIEVK